MLSIIGPAALQPIQRLRMLLKIMISQKRCRYYNRAALIRVRKLIQPLLYYSICFPANLPSLMLNADRIVGGQDATSEIPWQVSVRARMNTNLQGGHWCGGTILDAIQLLLYFTNLICLLFLYILHT